MFKKLIPILIIAILGILDFALIGFAWQNPTQAPPGGNLTLPWIRSGTNVYLANTSDNVGIGTTAPGAKLETALGTFINTNSATAGMLLSGDAAGNPGYMGLRLTLNNSTANYAGFVRAVRTTGTTFIGLELGSETNHGIRFLTNGTGDAAEKVRIDSSGNVGIGTTTPGEKLEVNGNVKAAAFYYGSDKSLKTNIKPFDKSLQKILNLEPVYFDYKENNQHSLGFIAQDVEKQFPELVTTDSLTGLKSLDYSRLTAPLVMAIKEQQIQIESQQQQINELKTQLNNL